jgi:hypothetical protein
MQIKIWEGEADDLSWARGCEAGYTALSEATEYAYDWCGHFEFLSITSRGQLWIASASRGYDTFYATLTKVPVRS